MLHFPLHCTARFLGVGISCPITQNLSLRHLLRVHHAWCNTLRHSVFITYPPAVAKYEWGSQSLHGAIEGNAGERGRERDSFISSFSVSGHSLCLLCRVTGDKKKKKKKKRKEYGFV